MKAEALSDPIRAAVKDELCRLEEDLLYTEKTHFAASEAGDRAHLILGLVATTAAAAAATTLIGSSVSWVSGMLALSAAIASAILTFVKPEKRAAQHLQSGRALAALRVRVRQARTIELAAQSSVDGSAWTSVVGELGKQKAEIEGAAPPMSEGMFHRARKKIQRGDFDHDSVPEQ